LNIFNKTAEIAVSGFLTIGAFVPAQASIDKGPGQLHYVPLTNEAAAKLPAWLKASDVTGMSVEMAMPRENGTNLAVLDTREQARELAHDVSAHLRHAKKGSFYSSQAETEYGSGVRALGQGRYTEAIDHLRAADKCVSGIPNERIEIG